MKMKVILLLLAGLVGALCPLPASAQSVSWPTFAVNQCWSAGNGIGGSSAWLCGQKIVDYFTANPLAQQPITTKSGSGAATSTATGGTLCWKGTAPTTWGVTFVAAPANGTIIRLCSDTTLTSMVTTTAGSGDSIKAGLASATITANSTVNGWQYNAADKVWYRIQ